MKSSTIQKLIFFFFSFICNVSVTFPQEYIWSAAAGGTNFDCGRFIASDKSGNTYIAGNSYSDPCYFSSDTISNNPFLVKYNDSGNEEWILELKTGPGSNWQDHPGVLCVIFDSVTDGLLLTGCFYNFLSLPDTTFTKPGANIFILKVDLDGHILWAKIAGGDGIDKGYGITSDSNGNIYLTGINQYEATFDQTTIPPGGFIAKYDANGNVIWVKNKFRYKPIFPYSEAIPSSILYANNSIYINGTISNDTIIIDTVTLIFHQVDFLSSFISAFSADGNLKWIDPAGGTEAGPGYQMGIDYSGNLYITGMFYGKGVFANDTITNTSGSGDCFLAKYNQNGQFQWVKQTNTSQTAYGRSVAAFVNEVIYLGGYFSGTINPGDSIISSSSGTSMFLASYTPDGHCREVRQFGQGTIVSITNDPQGNVCFTGDFENTLSIGSNIFYSHGDYDFFAAKYSPFLGGVETINSHLGQLFIYANPSTGACNIIIPEDFRNETNLFLYIYNSDGKLIQNIPVHFDQEKVVFNIQENAKGFYNAVLTDGHKSYSGKIILD